MTGCVEEVGGVADDVGAGDAAGISQDVNVVPLSGSLALQSASTPRSHMNKVHVRHNKSVERGCSWVFWSGFFKLSCLFSTFLIFVMRFFFLYVQSNKHTLAVIQRQIAVNKVINE